MDALTQVRFHTQNSPYHYTEDNKPLQDLAARDEQLKIAIETLDQTHQTLTASGDWSTMVLSLDLTQEVGKPFSYKLRMWTIENTNIGAAHKATLKEAILFGYVSTNGTLTLLQSSDSLSANYGGASTPVFTPSGSSLQISFTGYVGNSGYAIIKAERFGI